MTTWLQERFERVGIAVCTQFMRRNGAVISSLAAINKRSTSRLVQLVTALLIAPFFEAGQLAFHCLNTLYIIKTRRLGLYEFANCISDYQRQSIRFFPNRGVSLHRNQALRNFFRRLQRCKGAGEDINHLNSRLDSVETANPNKYLSQKKP